ncbi:MAG: ELM1/GtrOC1 family putative glycosyltransferase [Planctomycetaceae bacterium]
MLASDAAVVWRFLDGRTGHENQVLALSESLKRRRNCRFFDVPITFAASMPWQIISRLLKHCRSLPTPHLCIGAGHRTHLPMLIARHQFGGKIVVLMKPSLPCHLFDACLIPRHDQIWLPHAGVLQTTGVLNRVRPASKLCPKTGLILIGGHSRHFLWNSRTVADHVHRLLDVPGISWTIAASRRTPDDFLLQMQKHTLAESISPKVLPAADLLALMNCAGHIAVTCDSMSMISESLSSGAAVTLIRLPLRKSGRLSQELCRLVRGGHFTDDFNALQMPTEQQKPFIMESDRCAAFVEQHLLPQPFPEITPYPEQAQVLSGAPA